MANVFYVSENPKVGPNDVCFARYVVETPEEALNSWLSDRGLEYALKKYFEEFEEENFVDECVHKAVLEFEKNILKIFYEGVLISTYYAVLIYEDCDDELEDYYDYEDYEDHDDFDDFDDDFDGEAALDE